MNELYSVGNEVGTLLNLAHSFSKNASVIDRLGTLLLGINGPDGIRLGGVSELNNDGSPLQLCLSSNSKRVKLRLIADPASEVFQPALRASISRDILEKVLIETKTTSLRGYCHDLFETILGDVPANLNAFYRGVCWIGASPDEPGVALYLDTSPLGVSESWNAIQTWLDKVLPNTKESKKIIEILRKHTIPASIGLEAVSPDQGRAKIYWRLKKPIVLSDLGIAPLIDPKMIAFLFQVIGKKQMGLSGTVFSAGFDLSTGALEDVKIDLCAHCVDIPPDEWIAVLDGLTTRFGLQPFEVAEPLLNGDCEVAFLGMGISTSSKPRLNLYMKPQWPLRAEGDTANFKYLCYTKLQRAVRYLIHIQAENGSWEDYYLPVGSSIAWVTAYVGYALAEIGEITGFESARVSATKAADWLENHRNYTRGWGYNAITGADADSTGWTLRLFKKLNRSIDIKDREFLASHWKATGGFSTYRSTDHWGDAHPCVTATAYLGLDKTTRETWRSELIGYLRNIDSKDGQWPGYWWKNHLYSTYHFLELFQSMELFENEFYDKAVLDHQNGATAFERALEIGIMQYRNIDTLEKSKALLSDQLLDGRWRGGFNLRVTEPDCEQPWINPQGQLYRDFASTITTATVIKVLKQHIA